MKETTEYKPNEVYSLLSQLIESNDELMKRNEIPISISVVGPHGIGKTSVIREVAKEKGRDIFKLNLSQITEPSELIGYYSKEYEIIKGESTTWVTEGLLPRYLGDGFTQTGRTKTTPCPPDWIVNLKENGILLLDDFSRGNQLLMQSIMEIANEGTMLGWDLKSKNIQVILSENPEDGEYNVQSVDAAHTSRMTKIHMKWDADDWAERAEKIGTDPRAINFVLWAREMFKNEKKDGISASGACSPRMLDKFFSLVSTIDDFDKNLNKVTLYGDISVGSEITAQFNRFIKGGFDKLPNIDDLLLTDTLPVAKGRLTGCCGDYIKDSENWKAATAAILTTRITNFVKHRHPDMSKDNVRHLVEVVLHSSFSTDQQYLIVRTVAGASPKILQQMVVDPRLVKHISK